MVSCKNVARGGYTLFSTCKSQINPISRRTLASQQRNVVVTGIGLVTPLGCGHHHVWNELISGKCGIVKLDAPEYADIPSKVAALVPRGQSPNEFSGKPQRSVSLATAFAIKAAEEALNDAKWKPTTTEEKRTTGTAIGVGMVDLEAIVEAGINMKNRGYRSVSPFFVPRILPNLASGHVSIQHGLQGPNHCASTACATGAHSIGDAFRMISHGQCDVMVCGGTDACISPLGMAGFARARALSTSFNENPQQSSRPFDNKRDGFVMGEGAAILVLEEEEHALKRDCTIYARILGYGMSADASHITAPSEDGTGARAAMTAAMCDANVNTEDVTYINAHATSTPLGDAAENRAIKKVFGEHAYNLSVSSTKGAVGHLLGAAGAIEAAFTVLACHQATLPPTLNLNNLDENMDLDYVPLLKKEWETTNDRRIALTNSFGFGGTNASLCISSFQ